MHSGFSIASTASHATGPGVYGLSNADLDGPWPKTGYLRDALCEAADADSEHLLGLLADSRKLSG